MSTQMILQIVSISLVGAGYTVYAISKIVKIVKSHREIKAVKKAERENIEMKKEQLYQDYLAHGGK